MNKKTIAQLKAMTRRVWQWNTARRAAKWNNRISPYIYSCELCDQAICDRPTGHTEEEKKVYEERGLTLINGKIEIDHIFSVEDPEKGWQGWDIYFERLFVDPTKLQAICKDCHFFKTQIENEERRKNEK